MSERILLIKPSSIGDVVHALPFLKVLRDHYPHDLIHWLVSSACRDVVEGNPLLDNIVVYERTPKTKARGASFVRLLRTLRAAHYTISIDLQGLLRSAAFTVAAGAPVRVGFKNAREGAPLSYNRAVPVPSLDMHAVDRYLLVAESLGISIPASWRVEFPLFVRDEARRSLDGILERSGAEYAECLLVIAPAARWESKTWPAKHFAASANALSRKHGLQVIVTGSPAEVACAQKVASLMDTKPVVLAGKISLAQMIALVSRARLLLTNDSGPMHIADALGTPLVAVFGPTNPVRTGPYRQRTHVVRADVACAPCYRKVCAKAECMREVTPEMVMQKARQVFEETGSKEAVRSLGMTE